jgi:hypothetical protein
MTISLPSSTCIPTCAIRDDESPTGWKIEVGPFPGWADGPTC